MFFTTFFNKLRIRNTLNFKAFYFYSKESLIPKGLTENNLWIFDPSFFPTGTRVFLCDKC